VACKCLDHPIICDCFQQGGFIVRIEESEPDTWQELEAGVARILNEAGLRAERGKSLETARGTVNVDVVASDDAINPPVLTVFECKYWKRPVPQTVVHAFRTIIIDSGANAGFIVSRSGFQVGAEDAAQFSNIRLVGWHKFQEVYADRWFRSYMIKQIWSALDPLYEYVEPMNSRIIRKASALSESKLAEYKRLRHEHGPAVMTLAVMFSDIPSPITRTGPLPLPLRQAMPSNDEGVVLPDTILDAASLRALMRTVIKYAEAITRSFDTIFGERA
jgi:restriction system protein